MAGIPSHTGNSIIDGFKVLILSFAVFVVVASGATVYKSGEDEKKVSEYKVKVKDGDKDLDETIKIDTKEETELFHIASNGDTNPDAHERVGGGKVDVVYDFKQNMAMHRMSNQKACFLSDSTDNLPKLADLKKLIEKDSSEAETQGKTEYAVVGTVNDRSFLSDEMAAMCAKLSIYRIKQRNLPVQRTKRAWCFRICYRRYSGIFCWNICVVRCT
ncbi:uncharacterized protein [Porites lutea]|uniref:uncharacterized protein n=1 Tax=Porites lutea TaxID=51062 RepID=UPI003CC6B996